MKVLRTFAGAVLFIGLSIQSTPLAAMVYAEDIKEDPQCCLGQMRHGKNVSALILAAIVIGLEWYQMSDLWDDFLGQGPAFHTLSEDLCDYVTKQCMQLGIDSQNICPALMYDLWPTLLDIPYSEICDLLLPGESLDEWVARMWPACS